MALAREGRRLVQRALARADLDLRRVRPAPFGVRWEDDLRHYLRGRAMRVALDVGAHWGETALKLLEEFPGVEVHSFEPLPENFVTLERATASDNVRSVNAAVTDRAGTALISRGKTSLHASLHHGDGRDGVAVQAVTVDDYVHEHRLAGIDLLKIDTEGNEEAVLRGSLAQLERGCIEFVFCECEFTRREDEPHGDFRAILEILEPLDYRVVSFYTAGVDNLGWLWGDVLFRHAPGGRDPDSVALSVQSR